MAYTQTSQKINTAAQVAKRLEVSKKAVQKELREGHMKGVKRFGKWYVLESSLMLYMEDTVDK